MVTVLSIFSDDAESRSPVLINWASKAKTGGSQRRSFLFQMVPSEEVRIRRGDHDEPLFGSMTERIEVVPDFPNQEDTFALKDFKMSLATLKPTAASVYGDALEVVRIGSTGAVHCKSRTRVETSSA